ncbi:GreA/GreB family elongation factor [Methylophilaceae bacterium]|jgi:transcription elongation factor GreB|nr:GreA/GreB family elongation factor [Methylophilaceae bacterium]
MPKGNNYITLEGFKRLQAELSNLIKHERPNIVEIVSWAAGNGDRSENGDYIYGKKKLRQIDSRIKFLTNIIEDADIVQPNEKINTEKVFFGAYINLIQDQKEKSLNLRIVGQHETTHEKHYISWVSPLGKSLLGREKKEMVSIDINGIHTNYTIINIDY